MSRLSFIVLALVLCVAPSLRAQRLVTLNLGGGGTVPIGNLADGAEPGWHALAGIQIGSLMQPVGIRIEGAYNRLGAKASGPDAVVTSATLNFSYRLPLTNSAFSPYVIAGWGPHWIDCADAACDADLRYGGNAGLGTKFLIGFRGFVEARFHWVTGKVRYAPVTFGLTF